ncbi:MAG TPA: ferric reductase-like transmembrane domain-containing protein [Candidatus Thermoplasmatota archaeon]|nr:ferric reductase-like transmembrane domain-containing protein [Candidatus Thermoplasmatota archaeon]
MEWVVPGRRLGVVALLAVTLLATLAASQPNLQEEESYDSTCYTCHYAWSPVPMKTMFRLSPLEVHAPVGEAFEYSVQVEQAWPARPPDPTLVHFVGTFDVSRAPSVGFAGDRAPELGEVHYGQIVPDPGNPDQKQEAFVVVEVPAGASDLVFTLAPNSTDPVTGPNLILRVHPGRIKPAIDAYRQVDDTGRGQPERFAVHGGNNVAALGVGAWVLQARMYPVDPARQEVTPALQPVPFTLTLDAYFNTTGETRSYVILDEVVTAGHSTSLAWPLRSLGPPQPGEEVRITVNATAHYEHESGGTPNHGNFTKTATVALRAGEDGGLVLSPPQLQSTLRVPASTFSLARTGEAIGYLATFLLVVSNVAGGMFGAGSRRGLNRLFGSAKRRIAFHNVLSYFLTVATLVHMVVFFVEANFPWTLGLIWGGLGLLAMLLLGVTGALQIPMIRRWDYGSWRWTHLALSLAAVLFTVVHLLLDGANFTFFQDLVHWKDPFPNPGLPSA